MNRLTILLLLAWTVTSITTAVAPTTNHTFEVERRFLNEFRDRVKIVCEVFFMKDGKVPKLEWKLQQDSESPEEDVKLKSFDSTLPNRIWYSGIGNDTYQYTGSKLYWESISRNASGIYSCYESHNGPRRLVVQYHITVLPVETDLTKYSERRSGTLATGETLTLTSEEVESGRHFNLFCDFAGRNAKCDENKQIEWYFPPDAEVYRDEELYYRSRNVTPLRLRQSQQCSNVTGKNQWVLQVRDASYLDTGLYTCVNKTDNRTLSRHYIFVKDDKMLMLPPSTSIKKTDDSEHGIVVANLSQRAIISLGCGPTDPSKTISLARYSKTTEWADVLTGSHSKSETKAGPFRFNALRGFEFHTAGATKWDHDAIYSCTPSPYTSSPIAEFKFKFKLIGGRTRYNAGEKAAAIAVASLVATAIAQFAVGFVLSSPY